jgi:glucose/arabinose dehydrogenase
MDFSDAMGKAAATLGGAAGRLRQIRDAAPEQAVGGEPVIPQARPQGAMPTLKMPTARGWAAGHVPTAAPGLKVNAFAAGLKHPRWMHVLPNGDVTVAEALQLEFKPRTVFDHAMVGTMRRAAAIGVSPNRITLLRDADGDGVAELREPFIEGLNQPFGMALLRDTFYVGNTDGVLAFPHTPGATRIDAASGRRLITFKPNGHWTRSLLASPDGQRLYCGVGSLSNIGDHGFEVEEGRACIVELDLASGSSRPFATGLRNPVGMAWEPHSGQLWTVVNERDGLGDETPPDYLTSVRDGGFYGWPYAYWGRTVDDRVQPQDESAVARSITPDYALGGHTASLGLCWMPEGTLPGFGAGMVIGQHGSWNRSTLSGYRVVFVPFENGKPVGAPQDILGGFLSDDEQEAYGRPVGVTLASGGGLLVADDVGDVVWRVVAA